MTKFKNLLTLLNESIETTERMHKYYSDQLKSYESKLDALKELKERYLNQEEEEEEEEEKKGE